MRIFAPRKASLVVACNAYEKSRKKIFPLFYFSFDKEFFIKQLYAIREIVVGGLINGRGLKILVSLYFK